ncbi:MAG TPA: hypothetical protein VG965_01265 [Patescibacteria group bacterium]|nr:hypothetical protein [Patescibacteria group bacterium]
MSRSLENQPKQTNSTQEFIKRGFYANGTSPENNVDYIIRNGETLRVKPNFVTLEPGTPFERKVTVFQPKKNQAPIANGPIDPIAAEKVIQKAEAVADYAWRWEGKPEPIDFSIPKAERDRVARMDMQYDVESIEHAYSDSLILNPDVSKMLLIVLSHLQYKQTLNEKYNQENASRGEGLGWS